MRNLGRLAADLARQRRQWEAMVTPSMRNAELPVSPLRRVTGFGSNPGQLSMFAHVPADAGPKPALVVVLHGCTQTAQGYDAGAGWTALADAYGFAVLAPQQEATNNPKACFSWFQRQDIERDRGEALSIRQMIEHMAQTHAIDRSRIFVTGLSAGGAMTNVMLATYPEVFAGGAVIAGLPYRAAATVKEAFDGMFKGATREAAAWGELVRAASAHRGPWPRVSVWHGSADATVVPANAEEIVKQWTDVHGLALAPDRTERVLGHKRQRWLDASGRPVLERYEIDGMAHGTPLSTRADEPVAHGRPGPFLLDAGIASSAHIAGFFGLTQSAPKARRAKEPPQPPRPGPNGERGAVQGVGAVILRALRSAGLGR